MDIPGLQPTTVRVRAPYPEIKEVDPTRDEILINPETLQILQSVEGGTEEKAPEGFMDIRDFSEKSFENIVDRLQRSSIPERIIDALKEYRNRERS